MCYMGEVGRAGSNEGSDRGETGGNVEVNDRRVDGIIDNRRHKHAKKRR
jgi:hypothetical protein